MGATIAIVASIWGSVDASSGGSVGSANASDGAPSVSMRARCPPAEPPVSTKRLHVQAELGGVRTRVAHRAVDVVEDLRRADPGAGRRGGEPVVDRDDVPSVLDLGEDQPLTGRFVDVRQQRRRGVSQIALRRQDHRRGVRVLRASVPTTAVDVHDRPERVALGRVDVHLLHRIGSVRDLHRLGSQLRRGRRPDVTGAGRNRHGHARPEWRWTVDGVVEADGGVGSGCCALSEAQPANASRVVRPATHAHVRKCSMARTVTGQVPHRVRHRCAHS